VGPSDEDGDEAMILERIFFTIAILIATVGTYIILVLAPLELYAKSKCLEAGYPKTAVTWNWQVYCINLDGSVQVKVTKL
jgi:hypothetical protein